MDSSRQFLLGCGDVRTIADRVELHVGPPGRSGVDCGTPGAVSPRTAPGRAADAIDGACRPIDCRRDADEIQQFEPPLFFRCAIGNAAPRSGLIFFSFFCFFLLFQSTRRKRRSVGGTSSFTSAMSANQRLSTVILMITVAHCRFGSRRLVNDETQKKRTTNEKVEWRKCKSNTDRKDVMVNKS